MGGNEINAHTGKAASGQAMLKGVFPNLMAEENQIAGIMDANADTLAHDRDNPIALRSNRMFSQLRQKIFSHCFSLSTASG
jgi:hypothetical protein